MVNGKFRVIDSHCHIYPDKIAAKATEGTDRFYGEHSVNSGTVSDLLQRGKAAGVEHFVVQSVATSPKQVTSINEFIAKDVNENSGLLTGLGTLHPESQDIEADVARIISLGLHGVKLHPDIQQFPADCPGYMKIYELCEREGLPILLHTGDYRYDFSNPNRVIRVLKAFPGLTVVGAHLGGWSVWDKAMEILPGTPNLYVDCSSCFPFTDKEHVYRMIRKYGCDRVLFGTDYPMWSVSDELETFMSLEFTDDERRAMLSENAEKVFNINSDISSKFEIC